MDVQKGKIAGRRAIMFLSRDELVSLTGYKVPKCQIAWLVKNGVKHWIAATGRPVVPKSAIDGGGKPDEESKPFEPRYVA